MLWTMAVLLIILWMLGLGGDQERGLFIHALFAAAVLLLVVSIGQEARSNRTVKLILRRRDQNKRVNGGTGSI